MLWADAFWRQIKYHPKEKDEVGKVFNSFTLINAVNLGTVIIWITMLYGKIEFLQIQFNIFPGTVLNKVFWFLIFFYFPFAIINYFFVIRKKIYIKIKNEYKTEGKGYFVHYGFISVFLFFVTVLIYGMLDTGFIAVLLCSAPVLVFGIIYFISQRVRNNKRK